MNVPYASSKFESISHKLGARELSGHRSTRLTFSNEEPRPFEALLARKATVAERLDDRLVKDALPYQVSAEQESDEVAEDPAASVLAEGEQTEMHSREVDEGLVESETTGVDPPGVRAEGSAVIEGLPPPLLPQDQVKRFEVQSYPTVTVGAGLDAVA